MAKETEEELKELEEKLEGVETKPLHKLWKWLFVILVLLYILTRWIL